MTRIIFGLMLTIAAGPAVLGGRSFSAQDKYTVKVPNGLAFSEFRGYEAWQVVSISQDGGLFAAILANPVMIDAYKAGVPGNGKPFPDGSNMAKIHWNPTKMETFPAAIGARHPARRRLYGEGQQKVRGQRRVGMGYVRV